MPLNGVLARWQRLQKQRVARIDTWTQENFGNLLLANTHDIILWQPHIEERGRLKILQGIVDLDPIDFRRRCKVMARHVCPEKFQIISKPAG